MWRIVEWLLDTGDTEVVKCSGQTKTSACYEQAANLVLVGNKRADFLHDSHQLIGRAR